MFYAPSSARANGLFRLAQKLVASFHTANFALFFRLTEASPFVLACLASSKFRLVRVEAIKRMRFAFSKGVVPSSGGAKLLHPEPTPQQIADLVVMEAQVPAKSLREVPTPEMARTADEAKAAELAVLYSIALAGTGTPPLESRNVRLVMRKYPRGVSFADMVQFGDRGYLPAPVDEPLFPFQSVIATTPPSASPLPSLSPSPAPMSFTPAASDPEVPSALAVASVPEVSRPAAIAASAVEAMSIGPATVKIRREGTRILSPAVPLPAPWVPVPSVAARPPAIPAAVVASSAVTAPVAVTFATPEFKVPTAPKRDRPPVVIASTDVKSKVPTPPLAPTPPLVPPVAAPSLAVAMSDVAPSPVSEGVPTPQVIAFAAALPVAKQNAVDMAPVARQPSPKEPLAAPSAPPPPPVSLPKERVPSAFGWEPSPRLQCLPGLSPATAAPPNADQEVKNEEGGGMAEEVPASPVLEAEPEPEPEPEPIAFYEQIDLASIALKALPGKNAKADVVCWKVVLFSPFDDSDCPLSAFAAGCMSLHVPDDCGGTARILTNVRVPAVGRNRCPLRVCAVQLRTDDASDPAVSAELYASQSVVFCVPSDGSGDDTWKAALSSMLSRADESAVPGVPLLVVHPPSKTTAVGGIQWSGHPIVRLSIDDPCSHESCIDLEMALHRLCGHVPVQPALHTRTLSDTFIDRLGAFFRPLSDAATIRSGPNSSTSRLRDFFVVFADEVACAALSGVRWPPRQFVGSDFDQTSPLPDWNTVRSLRVLHDAIVSLAPPPFPFVFSQTREGALVLDGDVALASRDQNHALLMGCLDEYLLMAGIDAGVPGRDATRARLNSMALRACSGGRIAISWDGIFTEIACLRVATAWGGVPQLVTFIDLAPGHYRDFAEQPTLQTLSSLSTAAKRLTRSEAVAADHLPVPQKRYRARPESPSRSQFHCSMPLVGSLSPATGSMAEALLKEMATLREKWANESL